MSYETQYENRAQPVTGRVLIVVKISFRLFWALEILAPMSLAVQFDSSLHLTREFRC